MNTETQPATAGPVEPTVRPRSVEHGSKEHLLLIGAQWHLNLLAGKDLDDVLAFGKACMEAAEQRCRDYAHNLAVAMHAKHYPEMTQWRPLPDTLGLLTQMDGFSASGLTMETDQGTNAAEREQCADDAEVGGTCNVCGGGLRYGERHRKCGMAVMAAVAEAVAADRERLAPALRLVLDHYGDDPRVQALREFLEST